MLLELSSRDQQKKSPSVSSNSGGSSILKVTASVMESPVSQFAKSTFSATEAVADKGEGKRSV